MSSSESRYTIKISRPLDAKVEESMAIRLESDDEESDDEESVEARLREVIPQLVAALYESARSMDELIVEILGVPPHDSGAGFGDRDMIWYDVEWSMVLKTKELLDLGMGMTMSVKLMQEVEETEETESEGTEHGDVDQA